MFRRGVLVAALLVLWCAIPVADQRSYALNDSQLESVPGAAIPPGYGNYCSVTYPGGGWAFEDLTSGDSCGAIEKQFGSAGTIQRAGYWSTKNFNNAMVRCDGNVIYYYRGSTDSPLAAAFKAVKDAHLKNCAFTVAPVALPFFYWPYDQSKTVSGLGVFTYDHYLQKWNPSEFGKPADSWQIANCPNAKQDWCSGCAFDRTGMETGRCESCQASFALPPLRAWCRTGIGNVSSIPPATATSRRTTGLYRRERS